MQVKVKRLHHNAKLPTYGSEHAGCFDLWAVPGSLEENDFYSGDALNFRTGLAFEIPEGHVMMVYSRSGHGFKQGLRLANCVGVIDADYRGELMVRLHKDTEGHTVLNTDKAIAQAMIIPVDKVEFLEADELSDTVRGTGGFGSTG